MYIITNIQEWEMGNKKKSYSVWFGSTLCLSSNATKYESIAPHQDYVESRTIAHMRDDEKLFFVYFSFWEAAL